MVRIVRGHSKAITGPLDNKVSFDLLLDLGDTATDSREILMTSNTLQPLKQAPGSLV